MLQPKQYQLGKASKHIELTAMELSMYYGDQLVCASPLVHQTQVFFPTMSLGARYLSFSLVPSLFLAMAANLWARSPSCFRACSFPPCHLVLGT